MQKGDQYSVPFKIKMGGEYVTPNNCDDLKIKLGEHTKTFSEGTLTYSNDAWQFPLA